MVKYTRQFEKKISDHIDNYKVKNLDEITYNFRLSFGFWLFSILQFIIYFKF